MRAQMKRCPFCMEEIQDAAIVCRFCNRNVHPNDTDDPPSNQARQYTNEEKRTIRRDLLGGVAAVAIFFGGAFWLFPSIASRSMGTRPARTLKISAAREAGGLALTNQEAVSIAECAIAVLEHGDVTWDAQIVEEIASSATLRVGWSRFHARGTPMPSDVGTGRQQFTVSCLLPSTGERLSAGMAF